LRARKRNNYSLKNHASFTNQEEKNKKCFWLKQDSKRIESIKTKQTKTRKRTGKAKQTQWEKWILRMNTVTMENTVTLHFIQNMCIPKLKDENN